MNTVDHKKKAIIQSIIWFLSLQIIGYFSSTNTKALGSSYVQPFQIYTIGILAYVLLFSCPLLFSVKRHAKQANLKIFSYLVTALLLQHFLWVILILVKLVQALF